MGASFVKSLGLSVTSFTVLQWADACVDRLCEPGKSVGVRLVRSLGALFIVLQRADACLNGFFENGIVVSIEEAGLNAK